MGATPVMFFECLAKPRITHSERGGYILYVQGVMRLLAHQTQSLVDDLLGAVGVVETIAMAVVDVT